MATTFRDIKAEIRGRITDGSWKPGALLPGELELAERYGCARATVNRAMRELAEEGLLERKRKAGTRVRATPLREARFEIPAVQDEIEALGAVYRYRLISCAEVAAPGWLRVRLDLAEGARALRVVCVHDADGAPYQAEDRWISLTALPEARTMDFANVGPGAWLLETVPYSDVEISFGAVGADGTQAGLLGCAEGVALFQAERATWWQGQAITYVRLAFRPGYRMTTRY